MFSIRDHELYISFDEDVDKFMEKVSTIAQNKPYAGYSQDIMKAAVLIIEGQRAVIRSLLLGAPFDNSDADATLAKVNKVFAPVKEERNGENQNPLG